MFKLRTSKYRHVFCDQPKIEECWTEFQLSTVTGDQQYIKASAKYFVVGLQGGGGPMMVGRLDRPGRYEMGACPQVSGHSGGVLDMEWNPFDDSMMATASEDTNIKIWSIPEDWEPTDEKGMPKPGGELKESVADLEAHKKKVTLLRYHPTAANTLLSTAADYTIKVWDVESAAAVTSFDDFNNLIHDIVWDMVGDQYACSCKDKAIRLIDPRTSSLSAKIDSAHDGAKSVKLIYANDSGKMFSFGASKQSSREIKVWDIKNMAKPLHTESVDTAAGGMIPLWDSDTNVLYLCGKGDGIVRIYEYDDKEPFIFKLNDGFRSNIPGKGYCLVPKRGLDVMKHETARILKCTNNQGIHPLRFAVPRKSDAFQDDIFPHTAAPIAAHSFADWMEGSTMEPVKMSLDPANSGNKPTAGASAAAAPKPKAAFRSAAQISKDLDEAKRRIAELEALLKANNIAF